MLGDGTYVVAICCCFRADFNFIVRSSNYSRSICPSGCWLNGTKCMRRVEGHKSNEAIFSNLSPPCDWLSIYKIHDLVLRLIINLQPSANTIYANVLVYAILLAKVCV